MTVNYTAQAPTRFRPSMGIRDQGRSLDQACNLSERLCNWLPNNDLSLMRCSSSWIVQIDFVVVAIGLQVVFRQVLVIKFIAHPTDLFVIPNVQDLDAFPFMQIFESQRFRSWASFPCDFGNSFLELFPSYPIDKDYHCAPVPFVFIAFDEVPFIISPE